MSQMQVSRTFDLNRIKAAIHGAMNAVENAKQQCMAAGQMLNEIQDTLPHGEFLPWLEKNLPEIHRSTASRWMRAAANIVKALPPMVIDVDMVTVSEILTAPDADLTEDMRNYKQQWLNFTADKTIKDCLDGVCVEGDAGHRVDRAINGKLKGGVGKQTDRKDFPLFIAVKLKDIAAHLQSYDKMTAAQRSEIEAIFRAAILGDDFRLSRGAKGRLFAFKTWPKVLSQIASDTLKERLKGTRQ